MDYCKVSKKDLEIFIRGYHEFMALFTNGVFLWDNYKNALRIYMQEYPEFNSISKQDTDDLFQEFLDWKVQKYLEKISN